MQFLALGVNGDGEARKNDNNIVFEHGVCGSVPSPIVVIQYLPCSASCSAAIMTCTEFFCDKSLIAALM